MPMDALCLSAVLAETERNILGGRIDKIHQPSRDESLLRLRGKNGPCRLLLSANPSRARIQLTALPRENPAEPPMFCMLLRKYLSGGKILDLRQPPAERLAELVIEATNEMGDKVTESDKAPVLAAIEKLKEAQKGTDVAAIKAATDEVQKAFYAVSEKLYQNAAPQGDPNATPGAGAQPNGGNDAPMSLWPPTSSSLRHPSSSSVWMALTW